MSIRTFWELEDFGRIRLSRRFFMRDFLYSEITNACRVPNYPPRMADFPMEMVIAGRELCTQLLEPLAETFGHIHIRSGYRSPSLNSYGNQRGLKCASNEANYGYHIWGFDKEGHLGAAACIVIPWFMDRYPNKKDWVRLAWWIHDHLDYNALTFFRHQQAFNIGWHQDPRKDIRSTHDDQRLLMRDGELPFGGREELYADFPAFKRPEPFEFDDMI